MSTLATAERVYSAEDFWRLPEPPDGSKQELVRGRIVTIPPIGFEHGQVQAIVAVLLKTYLQNNDIGRVVVESGVITERDLDTVRGPDVSYWSYERLPKSSTPKGYPDVVADLCVEVRSPDQSRKKLLEKVREYLACGVRFVWIVDPNDDTVTTYQQPDRGIVHSGDGVVTAENVLPGFSVPASKFFR